MLLAMGCYTNVLVKAGFEPLADTAGVQAF